jgi:hypothetical protein
MDNIKLDRFYSSFWVCVALAIAKKSFIRHICPWIAGNMILSRESACGELPQDIRKILQGTEGK